MEAAALGQLELSPAAGPGEPSGEYLTIAEAARRVRCCERTIRRAIVSGALRAGRIRGECASRGGFRIRPADLKSWLFDDGA
jgi:excisionase family DNA binding protein